MKTTIDNKSVEIKKTDGKFILAVSQEITPLEIAGIMDEVNHRAEVKAWHEEEAMAGLI